MLQGFGQELPVSCAIDLHAFAPAPPAESDITGIEVHTDVRTAGTAEFSDSLLNQIQHLVVWGQKTNLMSVPTDCDQVCLN